METTMALIALAAVLVGPAIQLQISKQQIKAELVSANRQKWVDALREDLGQLCSLMFLASEDAGAGTASKIFLIETRLRLRLNPNNTNQDALIKTIHMALAHTGAAYKPGFKTTVDYGRKTRQFFDQIVAESRPILKQAWEQVKRGE